MITYNIQPNLNAWTNHTFVLAERCSNLGNAYQCTTAGTSTSGPTGTGSSINNGGVAVFKWLSAIDYVSLAAWSNAIVTAYSSSGLPDSLTVLVWNNGVISVPNSSTSLLSLYSTSNNGHAVLITAAAGESFRDKGAALSWDASNGVAFDIASGSAAANQYIYIDSSMQNVTISGLQFRDTNAPGTDAWIMINMEGTNSVVQDCIFDGYDHFYTGGTNIGLVNCVVVNRCTTPLTGAWPVKWDTTGTGYVEGCVFIATGGGGGPGSFITGLSSTAAAGIARNCGFFGASSPINSQNITGMWAVDHCIFDVTAAAALNAPANGFPSTNGTGNLFSATIANQFISATTDFRPKVGATTINAGVVDTTHNPAGDDIFRVARGAVWDIGAAEYNPLVASAALAIIHPMAVGVATLQITNQAHTNTLKPYSSGFSSGFGPPPVGLTVFKMIAVVALGKTLSAKASFNITAAAVIISGQSNQASCAAFLGERPESQDFSPDFGPYTFFYVLANAIVTLNATAAVNLPPLSAVGFLNDVAAGSSAIPAIACLAGATAIGAANAIGLGSVTLAAVASMSSLTTAVGSAAIIIQPLMSAGQTDNGSATVSFGSMLASAHAAGFDQTSATVAISTIVAAGVIGFSCSGTVNLPALAVVASATLAGQAVGLATLPPIRTPDAVRPELQADPSAGIFLLADGSGLILRADVPRARMLSESTNTSGTAAFPPLACVGLAFESNTATLATSVIAMVSVASFGQSNPAATAISPFSPAFSDYFGPQPAFLIMAAVGQATGNNVASALATLESLRVVVAAGQSNTASGTLTLPPVAVLTAAGQSNVTTSARNILTVAAAAALGQSDPATGSATISLTSVATFVLSTPVSALDTLFTLHSVGAASVSNVTAAVTIPPLVAAGSMTSNMNASATDNLPPLACVSVALGIGFALGTATFATLTEAATATQNDQVSATDSFMAIVPAGALSSSTNASSTDHLNITIASSAFQQDMATGSGTIVLHCVAASGLNEVASAAVNIESLSCVGYLMDAAQGRSTFPLVCAALLTQNYPQGVAYEIANIGTLTATASMSSLTNASGVTTIPTLSCIGQLRQVASAVGAVTLPPIIAAASMTSLTTATATAVIPPLACFAFTSTTFGIGGGTITITASGSLGGNNTASGFASVSTLAETNATLYVSPIGYEAGIDVIFWSA